MSERTLLEGLAWLVLGLTMLMVSLLGLSRISQRDHARWEKAVEQSWEACEEMCPENFTGLLIDGRCVCITSMVIRVPE